MLHGAFGTQSTKAVLCDGEGSVCLDRNACAGAAISRTPLVDNLRPKQLGRAQVGFALSAVVGPETPLDMPPNEATVTNLAALDVLDVVLAS